MVSNNKIGVLDKFKYKAGYYIFLWMAAMIPGKGKMDLVIYLHTLVHVL